MNPGKYRHFKGGRYLMLTLATHSETEERLVIYLSMSTGDTFARPIQMWTEEVVWPDGIKRARFIREEEAAAVYPPSDARPLEPPAAEDKPSSG